MKKQQLHCSHCQVGRNITASLKPPTQPFWKKTDFPLDTEIYLIILNIISLDIHILLSALTLQGEKIFRIYLKSIFCYSSCTFCTINKTVLFFSIKYFTRLSLPFVLLLATAATASHKTPKDCHFLHYLISDLQNPTSCKFLVQVLNMTLASN